uniref:NADH dehydrogenase [ubiquinone] 1 alpha subcomplex subunit 6 n=1 Tax=Sus scrofa TaxID=9823 RepID=A0A8D1ICW0_PIG
MAASGLPRAAAAAGTSVKPIFSRDMNEAKRRVRELYRAWYREVPNTGERATLRSLPSLFTWLCRLVFLKNAFPCPLLPQNPRNHVSENQSVHLKD